MSVKVKRKKEEWKSKIEDRKTKRNKYEGKLVFEDIEWLKELCDEWGLGLVLGWDGIIYGYRFVNVWMKYRNWRLDECIRIEIECIECNRDSISMMFVMNRSVLEC